MATPEKVQLPELSPASTEAEEAVVACLLTWPDEALGPALEALAPDDFYGAKARIIFLAIKHLAANGKPIDTVTICERLEETGSLDKAGGRIAINAIIDGSGNFVTMASLEHYIEIIRAKSARRKLIKAGQALAERAYDESKDSEAVLARARQFLSEISIGSEKEAPIVQSTEGAIVVEWLSRQVRADAVNLKEHSGGDIKGHLTITTTLPGVTPQLRSASFNFCALRTREEWARSLETRLELRDWSNLLEELCTIVVDRVRQGEPVVILAPDDDVGPAQYAIEPVIIREHPVILFGERGTSKSYTALLLTYLAALGPEEGSILDFKVRASLAEPLYLDWEGDRDSLAWRTKMLADGMQFPVRRIAYRRCARSLADDVMQIRAEVLKRGTNLVVVDSLGPACGGDLNAPQPAIDFFNALRSLGVSSLILAHTAKNQVGRRSVFGSTFFEALARSIWQISADQDEAEDSISVGLLHRKMNYGQLQRPIGLRYTFHDGGTVVSREDVRNVASMSTSRLLTDRIVELLLEEGVMTPKAIADTLGAPEETVRPTLAHLRNRKRVTRVERGKYAALALHDEDEPQT